MVWRSPREFGSHRADGTYSVVGGSPDPATGGAFAHSDGAVGRPPHNIGMERAECESRRDSPTWPGLSETRNGQWQNAKTFHSARSGTKIELSARGPTRREWNRLECESRRDSPTWGRFTHPACAALRFPVSLWRQTAPRRASRRHRRGLLPIDAIRGSICG